jgi:hypothetical protein
VGVRFSFSCDDENAKRGARTPRLQSTPLFLFFLQRRFPVSLVDIYLASRTAAELAQIEQPAKVVSSSLVAINHPPARTLSIASVTVPAEAAAKQLPVAQTQDAWRAEWTSSAELQSEFPDAECYAALRKGETAGRVKVISNISEPARATTPDGWRAEWSASTELQSEFPVIGDYLALRKGESDR